jgi:hypothetical protein
MYKHTWQNIEYLDVCKNGDNYAQLYTAL